MVRAPRSSTMARIIYALTSQGRGHSSRVTAMAEALEARGHTLLFCAGGGAGRLLSEAGREVVSVPVLRHAIHNNKIRLGRSLVKMANTKIRAVGTIGRLVEQFSAFEPDLLITDFESFSVRAAGRMGLPVMCFNHQHVLTHTAYEVPRRHAWEAWVARLVIGTMTPRRAVHFLVSSFFYPPLRDPSHTTLVAPILRRAVREIEASDAGHVLVYHNDPTGIEGFMEALGTLSDVQFKVYNFGSGTASSPANICFKQPEIEGFLADLASAKAVVSTAGFTLLSEALYLGKPLLAMPNGGSFEQCLNALYLERDGLGEACIDGPPTAERLRAFLERAPGYAGKRSAERCGNDDAVACIEEVLAKILSSA